MIPRPTAPSPRPEARDPPLDLGAVGAWVAARAETLDGEVAPPWGIEAALAAAGVLTAPIPPRFQGAGLGTSGAGGPAVGALLRDLGRISLSVARVAEAHINALRLICRYGSVPQAAEACAEARAGHLFGLWIADDAAAPVRRLNGRLVGAKGFASAAAIATRALITFASPEGERMAVIAPQEDGAVVRRLDLHGVRTAGTARIDLTGVACAEAQRLGAPGDYMRQPEISLGAWRALAVMAGGLEALVDALDGALVARGRNACPHQRARFGQALIARETAMLWLDRCARVAEAEDAGEDAANYVKLARLAVERCCRETIALAQRSAGMAAMVRPHPIERLCRDLAAYLCQPALDTVLDEAAAYFSAPKRGMR